MSLAYVTIFNKNIKINVFRNIFVDKRKKSRKTIVIFDAMGYEGGIHYVKKAQFHNLIYIK